MAQALIDLLARPVLAHDDPQRIARSIKTQDDRSTNATPISSGMKVRMTAYRESEHRDTSRFAVGGRSVGQSGPPGPPMLVVGRKYRRGRRQRPQCPPGVPNGTLTPQHWGAGNGPSTARHYAPSGPLDHSRRPSTLDSRLRDIHLVQAIPDPPLDDLHPAHLRLEEPGRGPLKRREEVGLAG